MKQIKLLLAATLLVFTSAAFGQTEKTVSAIKAGTKLTDADIGFLCMVSNADLAANRGAATHSATINHVSYSAGMTLTGAQANSINKAIGAFQKTYKTPDASRGAGLCYYWYYYCNGYGYCYYYKYWYYC
jgi:hypothetical protein